jgi:hypothetical protein
MPPERGGELEPRHRIREVGSIRATEEEEVRRWRGKESLNHAVEEVEVRRRRGEGARTSPPDRGGGLDPHRMRGEMRSKHVARRK